MVVHALQAFGRKRLVVDMAEGAVGDKDKAIAPPIRR